MSSVVLLYMYHVLVFAFADNFYLDYHTGSLRQKTKFYNMDHACIICRLCKPWFNLILLRLKGVTPPLTAALWDLISISVPNLHSLHMQFSYNSVRGQKGSNLSASFWLKKVDLFATSRGFSSLMLLPCHRKANSVKLLLLNVCALVWFCASSLPQH